MHTNGVSDGALVLKSLVLVMFSSRPIDIKAVVRLSSIEIASSKDFCENQKVIGIAYIG